MMNYRHAIYPGSFDPVHVGHVDIIERISKIFDRVTVLIAVSPDKNSLFSIDERKQILTESLLHLKNVDVDFNTGLTVDYMKNKNIRILVRGLRAVMDFEYEISMANMNRKISADIETFLVFASPEFSFLSSRGVKEVALNGGKVTGLLPPAAEKAVEIKTKKIQSKV